MHHDSSCVFKTQDSSFRRFSIPRRLPALPRRLALAEQLFPEPFLDRALGGADALEAGVLAFELRAQRLRHRHDKEVLDMLGVAAHQADHGFLPPCVHHEVVGVVLLGSHWGILGMPVVVAPLQIHGHSVLGREVPGDVERCEVLELCHRSAPFVVHAGVRQGAESPPLLAMLKLAQAGAA